MEAMCGMSVVWPITGSGCGSDLMCGGGQDGWVGASPKHLDLGGSVVVVGWGFRCKNANVLGGRGRKEHKITFH